MSETKHTPGPWRVENARSTNEFHIMGNAAAVSGGNAYVCSVIGNEDARLIAAAPELLEAAIKALGNLTGKGLGRVESRQYIANMLAAAIRKADG